jgi:DNA-binding CsgD family transcriptional regulator
MAKSGALRVKDVLAVTNLIGECRELGDDHDRGRTHLVARLADMIGAEHGCSGEMAGCRSLDLKDLGVVFWWCEGCPTPPAVDGEILDFIRDPNNWPSQSLYHVRSRGDVGACLTRRDLIDDAEWRTMSDYRLVVDLFGMDNRLWCFRPIPGGGPDEHVGAIFYRIEGRRDYSPRDRAVVRLAHDLIAPLVGGALARFSEPSPGDLPPRSRAVLACVLEGDTDKQVATRLSMTPHTVNAHTRAIYRHFGVRSRAELMARWIRRGWGGGHPWAEL